jgi:hypothetical protein
MDLNPYLEAVAEARSELLASLDPQERDRVEAASVAYQAQMAAHREDQARLADIVARRQAACGAAWEDVFRFVDGARTGEFDL